MSELDPAWYPTASAYLDSLPGGLNAYATTRVRAVWTRLVRDECAILWQDAQLPEAIRQVVTAPWADTDFIPSVISVAVDLMVHDRLYKHERLFLQKSMERARRLLGRPLFKVLTQIMSPGALLRSSSRHWEMFHQGSTLGFVPSEGGTQVMVMTYPANLYPLIAAQEYGGIFHAVLTAAGAKGLHIHVELINERSSRFTIRWEGA